jgi:hypothetical protein
MGIPVCIQVLCAHEDQHIYEPLAINLSRQWQQQGQWQ